MKGGKTIKMGIIMKQMDILIREWKSGIHIDICCVKTQLIKQTSVLLTFGNITEEIKSSDKIINYLQITNTKFGNHYTELNHPSSLNAAHFYNTNNTVLECKNFSNNFNSFMYKISQ